MQFRIALSGSHSRGRGLGTQATRAAVAYAFDVVGVHRLQLKVFTHNPRARHVYEKVGFVPEGLLREALFWEGAWLDTEVMGLLAADWFRTVQG